MYRINLIFCAVSKIQLFTLVYLKLKVEGFIT
jgi:hypothetical protein